METPRSDIPYLKDATPSMLDFVGTLYETAFDDAQWECALRQFAALMGAQSSILMMADTSRPGAQAFHQFGNDPAAIADYNRYFSRLDPLVAAVPAARLGEWVVDRSDDRMAAPTVREYHHDFLARQNIGAVDAALISRRESLVATISVQRFEALGPGPLNERQALAVPLICHLERAVRLHFQLQEHRLREHVLALALDNLRVPVAIVDGRRSVHCMNVLAEAVLADPASPLRYRNGQLSARHSPSSLERAVHVACAVPGIATTLRFTDRAWVSPYGLTVVPLGDVLRRRAGLEARLALVVLYSGAVSRPGDAVLLTTLFGLTAAEARLALALLEGMSVQEAAERLQVEVSTVRSHLKSSFAKMGCSSQAGFVRVCAGVLGQHIFGIER